LRKLATAIICCLFYG